MQAEEITEKLRAVFERRPEILFCFLFGSSAAGAPSPGDVDLAVFASVSAAGRLDWMADVHGDFCDALATNDVDLVHLNSTDNIMLLDEIVRKGRVIFERDSEARALFQARIWHEGIDFKEKRKMLMGV
jgi:predicted nucleotidyltransferase